MIIAPINLFPEKKVPSLDDVPQDKLLHMAIKIYLIGALAWDYTETVLDMVFQMKLRDKRKLSREIRALRLDYDRTRAEDLDSNHIRKEWELAQLFESINKRNFQDLCRGIHNEIQRDRDLDMERILLVEAVQMAMTVLDAMKLYAAQCDKYIRQFYPPLPHSIMPEHFIRLARLLPGFIDDDYNADSLIRKYSAEILFNNINEIELCDDRSE